ncbi:MAG: sugar transferase [Ruminococcus sp.]|nr:sugar transferase [Ruminococcus sp.]
MYAKYFKRLLDFLLSLFALILISPIILILILIGTFAMKGNPFFTQLRPGKDEKIFRLIKFRTMTCEKDQDGNLLPDEKRLTKYGKFLRKTSLDELPELVNILKGDMSFIGPRPLLVEYLPYYTNEEKHRHDIRPGLTGLAQISGRNLLEWDKRLNKDIEYVSNITIKNDIKIFLITIKNVLLQNDITVNTQFTEGNLAEIRKNNLISNKII